MLESGVFVFLRGQKLTVWQTSVSAACDNDHENLQLNDEAFLGWYDLFCALNMMPYHHLHSHSESRNKINLKPITGMAHNLYLISFYITYNY